LERRGYFFVDKIELGGKNMVLNFIPDGKTKNMSKIESKLDQKDVAGGKGSTAVKDKKPVVQAAEADGEVKLSKKELNKLKRKEKAADAKAAAKEATTESTQISSTSAQVPSTDAPSDA